MADIKHVSDTDFQAEVLESDQPVLVDFWAPWCGPCRVVAPVLEEIAQERAEDLKIVKLNIDENQQTAANFQILAIPTMVLFRNGAEAKRIQGAMPKKRLEAELEPAPACRDDAARRLRGRGSGGARERDPQLAPLDRGGRPVRPVGVV